MMSHDPLEQGWIHSQILLWLSCSMRNVNYMMFNDELWQHLPQQDPEALASSLC